jgi:putative Holliday junction resolvase
MRVLCLDVGDRFIGVAISDAGGITAHGLKRIERDRWAPELREIIDEYHEEVDRIVVGLPRMLDGSLGIQAEKVLGFVEELKKVVDLPVVLWDERLSTVSADRAMIEAGLKGRRRRRLRDKVAAVIILQSYLDSVRR